MIRGKLAVYSIDYLIEKFEKAVFDLATGEGDARARLREAYGRFWTIPLTDYPEHIQKERQAIERIMTRLPSRPGYVIQDNLRKMKNKTASNVCEYIWSICFMLIEVKQRELLKKARAVSAQR
jgi:hypothetical protein